MATTLTDVRRWHVRIFSTIWITYFAYYLCRLDMTVASTTVSREYGWSTEDFGKVLSAFTLFYATGQFVNGQLGDRFGARVVTFMGAVGSVTMNLLVFALVMTTRRGDAHVLGWLMLLWGANGFFQAMGWSPMVRVMTHWFPVETRGKTMGWLGTCYQLGAAASLLLATFLTGSRVAHGGEWRLVFLVPSLLFAAIGVLFVVMIRNQPEDAGLPPVHTPGTHEHEHEHDPNRDHDPPPSLTANVLATLRNPTLWCVALTFFMLDLNRYGFINWMPDYLAKHSTAESSARIAELKTMMKLAIHPLSGALGVVAAGWATDRFFGGRRAPVIAILLVALGFATWVFPSVDTNDTVLLVAVVAIAGFCTYGPHILMVGHAAQDFGKKSGASGAAGFIDAVGYIGASLAGWGAGRLIKTSGFELTFRVFSGAAFAGALSTLLIWRRHAED
jgi:sugar phosphate permease